MKAVKLTKTQLKLSPAYFLNDLGARNADEVYVSKEDYQTLKNNLAKQMRKNFPGMGKGALERALGWELLAFGANETLRDAIRPGYAILNFDRKTK